jgi:hypothetical protein
LILSIRGGSKATLTFGIGGRCAFVDTWYREDSALTAPEIAEIYADFLLGGSIPEP